MPELGNNVEIVLKAIDETQAAVNSAEGNIKKFQQTTGQATDKTQQQTSSLKGLNNAFQQLTGVSLTAAGAIGAGVLALKSVITEATEFTKINSQMEAINKSMGGTVGYTNDELRRMSENLSDVSAVSHDTILRGESLMMTFGNIGHDTFPQAMQAALNLSAAFGQDLQSSVILVGKALNDPLGMAAMRRIGVSFSTAQIEMGKELFKTGHIAEYQALVMQELNKEVGGVAQAYGETAPGEIEKANNAFKDLEEEIGLKLLPTMGKAANTLTAFLTMDRKIAAAEDDHRKHVYETSASYEDYITELNRAAGAAGMQIDAEGNLIKVMHGRWGETKQMIETGFAMNQTDYEAVKAGQALGTVYLDVGKAAANATLLTTPLVDVQKELKSRVDLVTGSFKVLTDQMIFNEASQGLDAQSAADLAKKMGLLNQDTYDAMTKIHDLNQKFQDGQIDLQAYEKGIEAIRAQEGMLEDKTIHITVITDNIMTNNNPSSGHYSQTHGNQGSNTYWGGSTNPGHGTNEKGFASGGLIGAGDFLVGERGIEGLHLNPGSSGYVVNNYDMRSTYNLQARYPTYQDPHAAKNDLINLTMMHNAAASRYLS